VSRFEQGEKDIQLSSVFNILGVLGMIDNRSLIFPEPEEVHYDQHRMLVMFWGQDGDKRIRCAISRESLMDHYKSDGKNLLKTFYDNRKSIEHEARRKYLENRLESDNTILIKTTDL